MLFEFPERYLLTYGKTGSTSLRQMCNLALEQDINPAYPRQVQNSDISILDSEGIQRNLQETAVKDKPITMVVRNPEQRLISALTMIVLEDYCNKMLFPENYTGQPKSLLSDQFYRDLLGIWSDPEYWQIVLDKILCERFPYVFKLGKVSGLYQDMGSLWGIFQSGEIDLNTKFRDLPQNSLYKQTHGDYNWYNLVNYYLDGDAYHLGNWQCYVPLEQITDVIRLENLNDWCAAQTDVQLPNTNTNTGRHIIWAENIYTSQEHRQIVDAIKTASKQIPQWPMFQQLISPENIRFAEYDDKQLWWKYNNNTRDGGQGRT